jgi:protein SCO1
VRTVLATVFAILLWPGATLGDQLPELGLAPAFSLISQDRKPVSLGDLRGKIVAVTFLYTACPDICPLLTKKLVEVQEGLDADSRYDIMFVAITLDPEHDTPEVLKNYTEAWGLSSTVWYFLTGPVGEVRDTVGRYGVIAVKNPQGFIDHNLVTSIVDARGILRVQYLGTRFDADEFRRDVLSLVEKR